MKHLGEIANVEDGDGRITVDLFEGELNRRPYRWVRFTFDDGHTLVKHEFVSISEDAMLTLCRQLLIPHEPGL